MKNQNFGVEIELTGITRMNAAKVIAEYFGTTNIDHECSCYDTYTAKDNKGRTWKIMRDGSINTEGRSPEYSSEVVTPILQYEDIEDLQEILRKLRKAGAKANSSCGIHIHVGVENHTPKTLRNLVNIMASKQDMIFRALDIKSSREHYCKKLESEFVTRMNAKKPKTKEALADEWYRNYSGSRTAHYNNSRYHGLNLHAVFTKGTIEFRLFNSTTHAGKLKAYIQFCLAVNNQALTQKYASPKTTVSDNECFTFRTWLLKMGLIGDEFKTARHHLLANLEGNIAWRYSA